MSKKLLFFLSVLAVGCLGGFLGNRFFWSKANSPVTVTERNEVFIQENQALVEAINKVGPAVINVKTRLSNGNLLQGSALVLTNDGLAVTLAELIPPGQKFTFSSGEESLVYQVLKRDAKLNLALVKLEKMGWPAIGFSESNPALGQRIFLLAAATSGLIVDEGIVRSLSATGFEISIVGEAGFSAGPLFDAAGNFEGLSLTSSVRPVKVVPASEIKSFIGF